MPPRKKPAPLVLVTGASGCVGLQLVPILLEKGFRVRGVDLHRIADHPEDDDFEFRALDLTDASLHDELVEGTTAVVNTAALVDIGKPFEALAAVNLEAVKSLYQAAARQGTEVFIQFSTGSAYAFKDGPVAEDDAVVTPNHYVRTKLLSEDYLRGQPAEGPTVNIIRPTLIYGPRGRVLLNMIASVLPIMKMLGGVLPRLSGGPRCNYVHSYDVAAATAMLVESPQPHGEVFNVANDNPIDVGEALDIVSEEGGLRQLGPALPYPRRLLEMSYPLIARDQVFWALNGGIDGIWWAVKQRFGLGDELHPHIDREMLDFVTTDVIFANDKIKNAGLTLRYPDFQSGWRQSVGWFQSNGWLPA